MVVSVKHKFTSLIPDSADTGLIRPSNWNDEHNIVMATARLLGRSTAGTGAAEEISLGTGFSFAGTTLNYTLAYTPVDKAGDTMTGDFGITKSSPVFTLQRAADTERTLTIHRNAAGIARWFWGMDASTSNDSLRALRRDAAGGPLDSPFTLNWNTGAYALGVAGIGGQLNGDITLNGVSFLNDIRLNKTFPQIQLDKTASGQSSSIAGRVGTSQRWNVVLGNSGAESGGNVGSEFEINRYSDAGAFIARAMLIQRASGDALFGAGLESTGRAIVPQLQLKHPTTDDYRFRLVPDVNRNLVLQGSNDSFGANFYEQFLIDRVSRNLHNGGSHTWLKSKDISNTDLNDLVFGGRYSGNNLTNAPAAGGGYWYVFVDPHTNGATYCTQEASLLTVGNSLCTFRRIRKNTVWGKWVQVSGYVTPSHFGAVGANTPNGLNSIDDTTALQAWMDSDFPKVLDRWYKATSLIDRTIASGDIQGFQIFGYGACSGIRLDTAGSIKIFGGDVNNPTGITSDQVTLRDFQIMHNMYGATESLRIEFADGDSGSSMPSIDMTNVHVIAATTTAGNSGKQIALHNVRNGSLRNVSGFGRYGTYNGTFLAMSGGAGSASVELTFYGCRAAHFQKGFVVEASGGATANDDMQGVMFDACTAIAVDRGFEFNGGAEGFGEWFALQKCHAYFREVGILGTNVGNVRADQNYLLAHGSLATQQGIALSGTSIEPWGSISYNRIRMDAATGTNRYGLNLAATLPGTAADNKVTNATNAYGLVGAGWVQRNNT